ncbi:Dyp-type peroxidase [Aspergillus violaceofuscus CBS 115571]|uniref:Dyp-type peroxidase n=4 Tax=Aspergillus TaxID=5052 RepID=A0A2V5H753_ASPV1|nr:Dyp-type peroxidase [Aspergillus violaceofuscus CBS 115571]PYI28968.1 Dyp-type peroxidase [Aspergillus indologenus CBS 114.80]
MRAATEKVDTDNIQGSIWPRLPKHFESYLFFKITDKAKFRKHLRTLLDNQEITTGTQCADHLRGVGEFEEASAQARRDVPEPYRVPFTAVNVAFTHLGLLKVERPEVEVEFAKVQQEDPDEYCRDRINEGLFEKGMFDDLVYEGADSPPALHPDFRAPEANLAKEDPLQRWDWRVDGVFIVAAHSAKALRRKIVDVEDAFYVGDANENSMKIAYRRDGQTRPGANRGKEHFGYEDHISQPKIRGLDPTPAPGEPHACPPGYIFLGFEGDPNKKRGPAWAKEGSFLVFRQLDQKVPEFEKFLEEKASQIPGPNYAGPNGPAKLGAHLMGRWKSGAPVVHAYDEDKPELAFNNTFDFRPKKSIKSCPFAAHIRKMRPRSDKKRDVGTEEDGDETALPEPDSDEEEAEGQEEDASVILRRGITFGPELTEEEKRLRKTIEHRGIYFTCYQSLIRDGFNFLMTRWASNASFPEYKTKTFPDGPGMDPFVNQRLRKDHPEGHISLYDGQNPTKTVKLNLGISPWVDQRGGEYFFTPSISALREHFSTA